MNDCELIEEYATRGSQAAFSELVKRYVNLVFGAARRQTRDASAAEDVTQAVFLILSQKAGKLRIKGTLAGWLYQTTRYAAANANRLKRIREKHEKAVAEMAARQTVPDVTSENDELIGRLDESIARLGSTDRDVVLMHYFQGAPLTEVGTALGLSHDAARKRLARSIEKMRGFFARKGTEMPIPMLVAMMGKEAVQIAPAHVVSGMMNATSGASATVGMISKGAMKMIFLSQLKPIIGTAAAAAMVLGGTAVVLNGAPPQRAMANAAPAPAVAAASIAAPATQATTPLSDLRILAKAIKNGDAETIQKYLHGSTPQEQAVCQQQAKLCKSIFEFRKAYGEAFGPKALAQLPALAGPISVPAGSKETIDGDTAIVEFPGAPIAINMVKADGVWKMDYSSIGTSSLPLSADQVAEWLKKMQLGIDEVTMRTTTGNYKTPAQAMGALQKMMVGLSRSLSKPTTAPAK